MYKNYINGAWTDAEDGATWSVKKRSSQPVPQKLKAGDPALYKDMAQSLGLLGNAPQTSANPPVLEYGTASEATRTIFIG